MCLYPRLIQNPKYKKNKKNQGVIPVQKDHRVGLVPIGCGNCMECRKQKANGWRVRLNEEIKKWKPTERHFVTLTFSEEELTKLDKEIDKDFQGYDRENEIATLAVRRFLERWRKKYKKSVKHWLVTELGGNGTERIHLHGLVFTDKPASEILEIWKYGISEPGKYVNETTVGYITKYLSKVDVKHKQYKSIILCSPGIGAGYTEQHGVKERHQYKEGKTREEYKSREGYKMNMPIYYRNKLYTEEEREKLWIEKLDKNVRYVNGVKIERVNTDEGQKHYKGALKNAQDRNIRLGYGKLPDWKEKQYEDERRDLLMTKRHAIQDKKAAKKFEDDRRNNDL